MVDRFLLEVRKNAGAALKLARDDLGDLVVVGASRFVIRRAGG